MAKMGVGLPLGRGLFVRCWGLQSYAPKGSKDSKKNEYFAQAILLMLCI